MSSSGGRKLAHVALLPSAGMGHLTPFLRLAALLVARNVQVTFITPHPTVSLTESRALSTLFASFPQIKQKQFHLLQAEKNSFDPFFNHIELIKSSGHLLPPLLSALTPSLSAFITDMTLASAVIPITQAISLPNYVLFTSSAKMMTLFLSYPALACSRSALDDLEETDVIKIRNLELMPKSLVPPPLLQKSDNLLKKSFMEESGKVLGSSGILVNTFASFEFESLGKISDGEVLERPPSVVAIGPLPPYDSEKSRLQLAWLDDQPAGSVLYVSFGSRTALARDQTRELGVGLITSGSRFVWVVKNNIVDKEDGQELEEVIGHELMERVKEKGLIVKSWVQQEDILSHPAVGGFLSHCGWNSVMEAAWNGVRILAWPQHGDQKVNADVVERIGLGTWVRSWGWSGEKLVGGAEIAERIRECMGNESLRIQAMGIKEDARKAVGFGGSSDKGLTELISMWNQF